MYGAIFGDIIGSYYEVHCTKNYDFSFHPDSCFTDDTVLTAAVCKAILQNPDPIERRGQNRRAFEYAVQYKQYYSFYPNAGYGQMFIKWASDRENIKKQHSFGNGAAMRVVPIGYAYDSLEQVLLQENQAAFTLMIIVKPYVLRKLLLPQCILRIMARANRLLKIT